MKHNCSILLEANSQVTHTIHLDAVGGVAGDMFVAAMLDARPDLCARVLADAAAVLPASAGQPELVEAASGALRARRFGLAAPQVHHHAPADGHGHRHDGDAGSFRDMVARIRAASLHAGTAEHAIAILTHLAEAEAVLHGVPVSDVHFHEIADWDSLLDVVAAGSIAAALAGARWTASPLPRGGGLVKTRHGLLPVPAPATAAILRGFAWRDDGVSGERVTPTGAAILRHLVDPAAPAVASGRLEAVGTGAGTRVLPGIPNVLRALVFDAAEAARPDHISVLSFEIDDMTGEEVAMAADRLRAVDGVVDLSIGQRLGKKGRAMQSFRLLVRPDAAQAVADRCFAETSTIGLRLREERRLVLPRRLSRTACEGQDVSVKSVRRPGGIATAKAESDDLAGDTLAARRRLKQRAEDGSV
ncbi:LarC family nickel insertion protein [Vineibacter terrae]|uniref:LarC family nickel insertion protein n=2 Tax=Vineibacter terrae TaxID=2586908 RepID=A0A5C8PC28_9HYPH|nr:LarC family nickel insertion protein [Vineibacter terrae]